MAELYIRQARGIFTGTVGSTAMAIGAPVYFDGTDWELADADDETKYAEAIAMHDYAIGDVGAFCRSCIIKDIDASTYTQGDQYFLSETAGAIPTATRPTTDTALKQVLGFGLSTTELYIDIPPVREETLWVDVPYAEGSAAVTIDGDWGGLSMTADADAAHGTQMFPENTVGIEIAYCWGYNEDLLATGNITFDVSAGVSDESGTGVTDGKASTAVAILTADDLWRADVTTAFDLDGIVEPGNHFGVDIAKASETSADDFRIHGVAVVIKVV